MGDKSKGKSKIYVWTSKQEIVEHSKDKISRSLIHEAHVEPYWAELISNRVDKKIREYGLNFVSGHLVRELVNAELLRMGFEEAWKNYTRVGLPVHDLEEITNIGVSENANQVRSPEAIDRWISDRVKEEYALSKILNVKVNGENLAEAHLKRQIYVHKLRDFPFRAFCHAWDARVILKLGMPPSKRWTHTATAGPAKHPDVAISHCARWLGMIQSEFSGGQGFPHFTTFLAPYVEGLDYREVKQLAQRFIFEVNQGFETRGTQIPFDSVSVAPGVAKMLRDVPAVMPGGIVGPETYGDFEDEARLLFRAIIDACMEGDRDGKMFPFPKIEVELKKEWLTECYDLYLLTSQLAAKFGTPYYLNQCAPWMPEESHSQCCRIIFNPEGVQGTVNPSLFDPHEHYLNMGSLQPVSINLPQISYDARGDDDRLFELLETRLELAKEALLIKRAIMHRHLVEGSNGILPHSSTKLDDETTMLDLRKESLTIGFVGLNEMVKAHSDEELHESKKAWTLGLKVIKYMRDFTDRCTEEESIKFNLWQQPAESTAHVMAAHDLRKYGERAVVQGNRNTGDVYYTNSNHLRPGADVPLLKRIEIESSFHPVIMGGVITHVFLGESYPDPEALWSLTEKIATKTLCGYFSYTRDFTQCLKCRKLYPGILEKCPQCGASGNEVEWWSRITGYYSRVKRWNPGKKQELGDRKRYRVR